LYGILFKTRESNKNFVCVLLEFALVNLKPVVGDCFTEFNSDSAELSAPTSKLRTFNTSDRVRVNFNITDMFNHLRRNLPRVSPSSFSPRRSLCSTPRISYADPWPLPHTPEHLASTQTPSGATPLEPLPRFNEAPETLHARLIYQSRKRGTLESDLLLSTFARDNLKSMTIEEMQEYDKVCC